LAGPIDGPGRASGFWHGVAVVPTVRLGAARPGGECLRLARYCVHVVGVERCFHARVRVLDRGGGASAAGGDATSSLTGGTRAPNAARDGNKDFAGFARLLRNPARSWSKPPPAAM